MPTTDITLDPLGILAGSEKISTENMIKTKNDNFWIAYTTDELRIAQRDIKKELKKRQSELMKRKKESAGRKKRKK